MMIRNLVQIIGGSALLACASMAPAKDVELFKADTGGEPDAPNVLFMFDNSANWKASKADPTKKEMEHQAFYEVISQPEWWVADDADPIVRVGIMTFAKGNNPRGGRVEEAVEGLDASYKDSLQCLLYTTNDCSIEQGKEGLPGTNNAPYALSMNEAYLYFAGKEPAAGTQDGTHDRAAGKRNSERTFPCHAGWLTMATPSMAKERSDGSSFLASSR
jgi:type IV pilus assembly protein PilY1